MKFVVTRTSCYCDEAPPCSEAKKIKAWYEDRRTISIEDMKQEIQNGDRSWERWLKEGVDHEDTEDGSRRFLPDNEVWVVELDSLKSLMKFSEKYGSLVFSISDYWVGKKHGKNLPEIEIYDDYRE